ncbi:MAG: EthD family reductase [Acidimicrobiia bacterium]
MISVTILYPRTDDSTFDMEYYRSTHMPMFADALGGACKSWTASFVAKGPWAASGFVLIENKKAFDAAMANHGAKIAADVANYTNVVPTMVIGQVV